MRTFCFLYLAFILLIPINGHCFQYLSGSFTRTLTVGEPDTVQGFFYYNRGKKTVLLDITHPTRQIFFSSLKKFIIYYPQNNTAYVHKGKNGEGVIDFIFNFLGTLDTSLFQIEKSSRLLDMETRKDTIHYFYESNAYNKKGALFKTEVRKQKKGSRQIILSAHIYNQNGDIISSANYEDYTVFGNYVYPAKSYLRKHMLKKPSITSAIKYLS